MVFEIFAFLGLGLMIGIKHSLESDHIAAVSALSLGDKSFTSKCLTAISWGMGHYFVLFIASFIVLFFRINFPEKISAAFELTAAIALILVGLKVIRGGRKAGIHLHKHSHGSMEHIHFHSHHLGHSHSHAHSGIKKSLFMGALQGLAGSAAITLLAISSAKTLFAGLIYITIFGLGSIFGMVLVTITISQPDCLAFSPGPR